MPRKGRGGYRQGTPGANYQNRSDLATDRKPPTQAVTVASGQPYGERAAQEAAQRAIPLPAAPPVRASTAPAPQAAPAPGPFDRPTDYPNEPLTAGLPIGPGPGPEAVRGGAALSPDDVIVAQLRAVMRAFPSSDVARLLEYYDRGGGRDIGGALQGRGTPLNPTLPTTQTGVPTAGLPPLPRVKTALERQFPSYHPGDDTGRGA